jgi:hypothetical protein
MGIFSRAKPADPRKEFADAIHKAIAIGKLQGVKQHEMSAVLSDYVIGWERHEFMQREMRNYGTAVNPAVNESWAQKEKTRLGLK